MPKRIQRSRSKGWRMPRGAVYVGRPTEWGNPFVGERAAHWFWVWLMMSQRATVRHVLKLAAAAGDTLSADKEVSGELTAATIIANLDEIRGKDLACWCPLGQSCHADVLLEFSNAEIIG